MNSQKASLIHKLQQMPNCVPVGDTRIHTRCVLCGDSSTNLNKKRLYIKCDPMDTEPVEYICFNCGESGILTKDMLHLICENYIGDDLLNGMIQLLKKINKDSFHSKGNTRSNKYNKRSAIKLELPPVRKTENSIRKLKYLTRRLGTKEPINHLDQIRVITDLYETLELNGIYYKNSLLDTYNKDYIGFASVQNEYIILRDITNSHQQRHVKYNIFGLHENTHSFYTIGNTVNTITMSPIHIILAEGVFDILSVAFNVIGEIPINYVFSSVSMGTFYNPLLFYFNKGIVGENIFIEIYKDNDSKIDYQALKNKIKPYTKHFKVFYNSYPNQKDFGVPSNRIQVDQFL